jgi:hypothetical protein
VSVSRETMDCYRVRAKGEWATICVREWEVKNDALTSEKVRYCGEILIHSTFGSWANSWTHCGCRFKKFLTFADFDYLFTKFMGGNLHTFDGEKSLKSLRKRVIEFRRNGSLDKDDARELWGEISDNRDMLAGRSVEMWVEILSRVSMDTRSRDIKRFLEEPWNLTESSDDMSAVGFWRDLWPDFKAELVAEIREPAEALPS